MASRFNNCLITGCGVHIPGLSLAFWGDLFAHGEMYILNGGFCSEDFIAGEKCLVIESSGEDAFFERNGVVVVPKIFTALNQQAKEYLNV